MAPRPSYSSWWARAPGRWIQTPLALWSRCAHSGGGGRPRSSSPSPLLFLRLESASADPWTARNPEVGTYGSRDLPLVWREPAAADYAGQASACPPGFVLGASTRPPRARPGWPAAGMLAFVTGGSRARRAPGATARDGEDGARRRPAAGSRALERTARAKRPRRIELALGRVGVRTRFAWSAFASRFASARISATSSAPRARARVHDAGGEQVALDLLPALRVGGA